MAYSAVRTYAIKKEDLCNVGWSEYQENYTSVPLASPLSQSSTYSMDSGYLEPSGSSPSQIPAMGMTYEQLSDNTGTSQILMPSFADYNDHDSLQNCLQEFCDTQVPVSINYSSFVLPSSATAPTNINVNPEVLPELEIIEQPSSKPFRFRYKSEMHGTHGSLMGAKTVKTRRTYPTVALRNFNFASKAIIRCTLYQVSSETDKARRSPHSHKLVIRRGDSEESDPHDVEVSNVNNFTATFQGMGIIHTAKRHIRDELYKKMRAEREFEGNRALTDAELSAIERDAEKQSKEMNLNQVCLGFQAFIKNEAENKWFKLGDPVYSTVVNNMKSALTGELKIIRMSTRTSPASGGQEIFMFVEKVCKNNIKVKFFEQKENGEYWEAFGVFNESSDVHHQYGIVLKTPPYKNQSIESPVSVKVQLLRQTDGSTSEEWDFRYKPNTQGLKRRRTDSSEYIPTVVGSHESSLSQEASSSSFSAARQNQESSQSFGGTKGYQSDSNQNYAMEESMFPNDSFPSFVGTFLASDLSFSSNDLKGLWNPEEFCRFFDIDVESKLQIDGAGGRRGAIRSPSSDLNCSLVDKLKIIIKCFKNNFDDDQLQQMLMVLVEALAETGENILLDCIQHGSIDEVKDLVLILVKYKLMDVLKSINDLDQNCFHLLILAGYTSLLKVFLNLGVDVNQADAFGQTPMHVAVMKNSQESVEELLSGSASIKLNELNDVGFAPLHLAIKNDNLAIAKLLLAAGADVHKKSLPSGNNVLHMAVAAEETRMETISFLVERNEFLLYQENNSRMNVLQLASETNKPEELRNFLAAFYEESYTNSFVNDGHDSEENDEQSSESENEEQPNELFDERCLQELCRIFDSEQKWESLLILMELESKMDEWAKSSSPSRNLFKHLVQTKKTLEYIVEIFSMLDETRAITVIDEMLVRKFDK